MDLFLIRHAAAEAADPAVAAQDGAQLADARRPLTARGRARFAQTVAALGHAGVRLDRLVHSPLLRAVETADLLVPLLRGTTEVCADLAAAPTEGLLARLEGASVAAVGHQPYLGELLSLLSGAPPELVLWRKGGLVWLVGALAPGAMKIRAVVSRRLLAGAEQSVPPVP